MANVPCLGACACRVRPRDCWVVSPFTTSTAPPSKTPTYTEQQISDAKARSCAAFDTVLKGVTLQTHGEASDDPAMRKAQAVNGQLSLVAGGGYLRDHLEPATPHNLPPRSGRQPTSSQTLGPTLSLARKTRTNLRPAFSPKLNRHLHRYRSCANEWQANPDTESPRGSMVDPASDLSIVDAAATKRQTTAATWHQFSEQLRQELSGPLNPELQKGMTADCIREAFKWGADQARMSRTRTKPSAKLTTPRITRVTDLNSQLDTIADDGKSRIDTISKLQKSPP